MYNMDKNLPDIENLFRSNLDDNEEMPSSKVWDGVEKILDKDTLSSIKKKYSILKRVAILLLLLLTGLFFYDLHTSYKKMESAKGNKSMSKIIVKPEGFKGSTNIIIPRLTDSLELVKKDKAIGVNGLSLLTKEDSFISIVKKAKRMSSEYFVKSDLKQKKQNVLGSKNKVFLARRNKIADTKTQNKKLMETYSINQINRPEGGHNRLPGKGSIVEVQNKLFLSEVSSLPIIAGKFNVSMINTIKIQPAVILITTSGINNNLSGVKKVKDQPTATPSRLSASLYFSPDFAWYRLQNDVPDNQAADADEIEKSEQHDFSSSTGVLIDYKVSKHWIIQSGLTFSNTAITVEPKTIYAQSDNSGSVKYRYNTSSGYSYVLPSFSSSPGIGDSLYAFTSTHTLQYIGIPIAIKYNFTKSNFNFNAMLGLSANFLTKGKIETVLEKGTSNKAEIINKIQGLKSNYLSGLLGVGAEYNLSKRIAVTFMPTARFAVSAINKGAVVKSYPNSFGLATGIRVKL
jgi:hypothetical protein